MNINASLPYTVIINKEDDGHGVYYVARVIELPHLLMTGAPPSEALEEFESVKKDWIEQYLKLGNKRTTPLLKRTDFVCYN